MVLMGLALILASQTDCEVPHRCGFGHSGQIFQCRFCLSESAALYCNVSRCTSKYLNGGTG